MKFGDILSLRSCKNGSELLNKVEDIMREFNISVYNESGMPKDMYALCCDVAEVLNKEK